MSSLADTFEHLVPVGPRLTVTPVITPTIAPLGRDRLIPVRNVQGREVVVRGGATGREYRFAPGESREAQQVTVQYREFGIRLRFQGEILSDSLIKLSLTPEVSSLDYGNAILLQGFRIPAFRTRRVSSTLDVRRNQSLIISGLLSGEEERVKTGLPFLKDIPILGQLFSSTRFQKNETELLVIVTPVIVNPMQPRAQDTIRLTPDSIPALEALKKRIPGPVKQP